MPRFVFRQKSGDAKQPVKDLAAYASTLGGKVLSQTEKMLYVEGSEELFRKLSDAAPDYVSAPEARVHLPKPPLVAVKKRP
jgi:hypothetical protein